MTRKEYPRHPHKQILYMLLHEAKSKIVSSTTDLDADEDDCPVVSHSPLQSTEKDDMKEQIMSEDQVKGVVCSPPPSSSLPGSEGNQTTLNPRILGLNSSSRSPTHASLSVLSPSSLLNQPIFVAISTNPMILVPCSYNASTGGLSFINGSNNLINNNSNVINQSSSLSSHEQEQVFPQDEEVSFFDKNKSNHLSPKESSLNQPRDEDYEEDEREGCSSNINMNNKRDKRRHKTCSLRGELQPLDLSSKTIMSGEEDEMSTSREESSVFLLSKELMSSENKLLLLQDHTRLHDIHTKNKTPTTTSSLSSTESTTGGSTGGSIIRVRPEKRRHSNAIIISSGTSFLNKPPHEADVTTDDNSRSSCYSPPPAGPSSSLPIPAALSGIPLGLPLLSASGLPTAAVLPTPSAATDALHHQGLVKQGTYKCKDCNIVFYKHENYLVHKSLYCASRRLSEQLTSGSLSQHNFQLHLPSSPSPDPPESDHAPHSSPEHSLDGKPSTFSALPLTGHGGHTTRSSPGRSPGRSVTSSPPLGSPPHHLSGSSGGQLCQFCCVACGIRFSSFDTLRAHQTFYCLKRAEFKNLENGFLSQVNGCHDKNEAFDRHHGDRSVSPGASVPSTNGTSQVLGAASSSGSGSSASHSSTTNNHHHHNNNHNSNNHNNQKSSHGSQSNLQYFKCTICGYKGHTMRGMRTHVRLHADKMQGMTEETFIEDLHEDSHLAGNEKRPLTGPGSRGSRRRSLDPETASTSSSSSYNNNKRRRTIQLKYQ